MFFLENNILSVTKQLNMQNGSVFLEQCLILHAQSISGCGFTTCDIDAAITAALLTVHNNERVNTPQTAPKQKASKIQRPTTSKGATAEA